MFFQMGETARAMFAASADLPADDSANRSTAAEAAGLAIDAPRQLMDATASHRTGTGAHAAPARNKPRPDRHQHDSHGRLHRMATGFESVRAALPSGIADQATAALETISSGLETTQTASRRHPHR